MNQSKSSANERKLARQNAELRFDQLCRDLAAFSPDILGATINSPPVAWTFSRNNLPPIEAPLGDIATHDHPDRLPVIGVRLPPAPDALCISALAVLFSEHRAQPFFRPVFLVPGYDLLPLLGRYGFAYYVLSDGGGEADFEYLAARFGMVAVRELIGADPIWTPPQD